MGEWADYPEEVDNPMVVDDGYEGMEVVDLQEFFEQLQLLRESSVVGPSASIIQRHPPRRCTDVRVSRRYL